MKQPIRVNFAFFWPGFTPETFRAFFPFVYEKYEITVSPDPQVIFYSAFAPNQSHYPDPRDTAAMPRLKPGKYQRVFLTGENFEPRMDDTEFAITFSALVDHPNHLRLPLWVYENRAWGYPPERLIKEPNMDWEEIADRKSRFCNFVYAHPVEFRDFAFRSLSRYRQIDSAGSHLNNLGGRLVPHLPNRTAGKVGFFGAYKFTLAIENMIWPGYQTEKLVDPMYAASVPIYMGDPMARRTFDPNSYIDLMSFSSSKEMFEFVAEVDNNRELYLRLLSAPHFLNNRLPECAREDRILSFFDQIFGAASAV